MSNSFKKMIQWLVILITPLILMGGTCSSSSADPGNDAGTPDGGLQDGGFQDAGADTGPTETCPYTCQNDLECATCAWGSKCLEGECSCEDNAHCAQSSRGHTCDIEAATCGCQNDTECGQSTLGPKCHPDMQRCGCLANEDCTNIKDGHMCDTDWGSCGCAADTDCPTSQPKCDGYECTACLEDVDCNSAEEYCNDGACIRKCKNSTDCANNTYQKLCEANIGKCVECMTTADCTDPAYKYCDTATFSCTECVGNTDCANSEYGLKCFEGYCGCEANSDCPANNECFYGMCFPIE